MDEKNVSSAQSGPNLESVSLKEDIDQSQAPLMDHLLELRGRLIKCVLAFVLGCIACIPFLKLIIQGLMWPFERAIVQYNIAQIDKGLPEIDLGLIATNCNFWRHCSGVSCDCFPSLQIYRAWII